MLVILFFTVGVTLVFVRLLMLFVAAAALLAQAPEALACPAHDEGRAMAAAMVQTTASDSAAAPLCHTTASPSTPRCAAQGAATLCGHFHLCCVTPPGLPASEVLSRLSPAPRTAVASRSPADTGITSSTDTPPPRS